MEKPWPWDLDLLDRPLEDYKIPLSMECTFCGKNFDISIKDFVGTLEIAKSAEMIALYPYVCGECVKMENLKGRRLIKMIDYFKIEREAYIKVSESIKGPLGELVYEKTMD